MHSLIEKYKVVQLLPLQAIASATTTKGDAVDCIEKDDDMVAGVMLGAMTGAHTCDVKIQESNTTTDGDFTDITGATFVQTDANDDSKIASIGFKRTKRYIRAVVVTAGTVTANDIAIFALQESTYGKAGMNSNDAAA